MTLEVSDEHPSCCKKFYIASVTVYGKTITKKIETKRLDSHTILLDPSDPDSGVKINDYALYDQKHGRYFDYNGELAGLLIHFDPSQIHRNSKDYHRGRNV